MFNARENRLMGDNTTGSQLAAQQDAAALDVGAQVIGDDGRPPVRIVRSTVPDGFVDPRDAWRANVEASRAAAEAEVGRIPGVTITRGPIQKTTPEPGDADWHGYGS